jgi:hypothetical protein
MPTIAYIDKRWTPDALAVVERANQICAEYAAAGYDLTLRQLYYQFVARGYIPNDDKQYKRLGKTISDARLAGLLDWNYIVDRTRNLRDLAHWASPNAIVDACASQFRTDRWREQPYHVEVWIEKDALVGVIQGVCNDLDVPHFSCRGYTSQSELWGAAQRLIRCERRGQQTVIVHLGDHDPSGIDMTRDIRDRLRLFGSAAEVNRIALTWDQVQQYQPPPNPAKLSDARAEGYIEIYGDESWELDALSPDVLAGLIRSTIEDNYLDADQWADDTDAMMADRDLLAAIAGRWADVAAFLRNGDGS